MIKLQLSGADVGQRRGTRCKGVRALAAASALTHSKAFGLHISKTMRRIPWNGWLTRLAPRKSIELEEDFHRLRTLSVSFTAFLTHASIAPINSHRGSKRRWWPAPKFDPGLVQSRIHTRSAWA